MGQSLGVTHETSWTTRILQYIEDLTKGRGKRKRLERSSMDFIIMMRLSIAYVVSLRAILVVTSIRDTSSVSRSYIFFIIAATPLLPHNGGDDDKRIPANEDTYKNWRKRTRMSKTWSGNELKATKRALFMAVE